MADEHDDGPSDPAKVRATITAALAGGLIKLPGFTATATTDNDGTATFRPSPQPVTLYRAINALGGVATTTFDAAYCRAIEDALAILKARGFTEEADAINPERFDITKRADVRQNALLAIDVLDNRRRGLYKFTHGDADKVIGSIRQLLAAHDDMEVHRDAARDALSDMRDERDRLRMPITESAAQPVTHATRPEVEILLAGRHDLMVEVDRWTKLLAEREIAAPDCDEVAALLGRLGAYIVGQDTRLIAAGEALETERRRYACLVDTSKAATAAATKLADDAIEDRNAAVVDRDKADAARGMAERDHRAYVELIRASHAATVASLDWVQEAFERKEIGITLWGMPRGEAARQWVEGLKADVRSAEKAFEEERGKREIAETTLTLTERDLRLAQSSSLHYRETLIEVRDYLAKEDRFAPTVAIINKELARLVKPRCRVVTSPRFYSDADRERACHLIGEGANRLWMRSVSESPISGFELVDMVAGALGMRRAEA